MSGRREQDLYSDKNIRIFQPVAGSGIVNISIERIYPWFRNYRFNFQTGSGSTF